jgi:acyl carrier protein
MSTMQAAAVGQVPAMPSPPFETTLAAMRDVLSRRFGIEGDLEEGRELASLGLDSLAFVEYSFEIEKELGILLPDIPTGLGTVGELARFVHRVVEQKAAGGAAR